MVNPNVASLGLVAASRDGPHRVYPQATMAQPSHAIVLKKQCRGSVGYGAAFILLRATIPERIRGASWGLPQAQVPRRLTNLELLNICEGVRALWTTTFGTAREGRSVRHDVYFCIQLLEGTFYTHSTVHCASATREHRVDMVD
jgi:hypothetical protein